MTELTGFDLAVLQQLGHGVSKALPGRLLAQRLHLRDTRQIRLAIIRLIEFHNQVIIGDSKHGYYIAETTDDGAEACERLMKTLRSIGHHHQVLKRAVFKKLSGQLSLVR
jgi:hypothetical protein